MNANVSHLLQMRGLKPKEYCDRRQPLTSHLLQMRGLKPLTSVMSDFWKGRIFYRCVD